MATIPAHEAARKLGIDVAELFLWMAPLGIGFDDAWPAMDEGFVETVGQMHGAHHQARHDAARAGDSGKDEGNGVPEVSAAAASVLDKLVRKDFWGHNRILRDKIRNHMGKLPNLDGVLEELVEAGLLTAHDGETYSLPSSHKKEIEAVVEARRKR